MSMKIEDLRYSSSAIDAFFNPAPPPRVAASGKMRIGNLQELVGFSHVSSDTLVHLSQQDFWQLGKDQEGFFIERLVDDSMHPVKG